MAAYDFKSPRLYLDARFAAGAEVPLEATQANYLLNVLRLKRGEAVLAFNGRDGEWRTALAGTGKRCDLAFLVAPLKHARLDYMVQKAVEMGVAYLQPVITRHTQVARVNLERMRANAIEAAEQCGILALPQIEEPRPLPAAIAALKSERLLVFCDEEANGKDPVAALRAQRPLPSASCCSGAPIWCGCRSVRASFGPTPPRLRGWLWCRPCSATGQAARKSGSVPVPARRQLMLSAPVEPAGKRNVLPVLRIDAGDAGVFAIPAAMLGGDIARERPVGRRVRDDTARIVAGYPGPRTGTGRQQHATDQRDKH
jgi:16S rRNA (uracil1498-N3)-methyltransferase